jgi:VWFA-related protein
MDRLPRSKYAVERRGLAFLLLGCLVAALPALPTAAQQAAPEASQEIFIDVLDVNVVNVEVVVTDRQGNPVRGLTRDDFRLYEDGEEVALTNFYAVESAQRVLPSEDAGTAQPVLTELPVDQRLHLAVVIDNVNISPAHRKRVLDQLRDHVERVVRPGDEVMVGTISPFPRLEQPFTQDLAAVNAALDRIGRDVAGNQVLAVQYRQIMSAIATDSDLSIGQSLRGPLGAGPDNPDTPENRGLRALNQIRSYADQAELQVRRTFAGLEALIASMSGLPGRKAVLYVSEGVQTRPAEQLMRAWFDSYDEVARTLGVFSPESESGRYDVTTEMIELTRRASASRVTFYTLSAEGPASAVAGPEYEAAQPVGLTVDVSNQDSLLQLAAATGGSSMLNPANVAALLDRMSSDYSDYYSLGYVSPHSRDGEYHRLEVKVPGREKVRIRHTEGYRGDTVAQEMANRTVSALVLDVAENPLNVRIELGDGQKEGKKNQYVLPVLVKVPLSKLALVPQQHEHRGKLSIYVAVRDDQGRTSEPQHFELPVDVPNEQLLNAMSRDVGYGVNLLVRGGESKLAVGVRDEIGAVVSTVNLNVSVGEV